MDSILAVGVGLGLRALIDNVTDHNLTASALVGIWEGVVLNHFLLKHRTSSDPYIAFGFRLIVDFMFTESLERMTLTVLWAFLGMVFADLGGDLSKDRRFRRTWRRILYTFPFLSSMSRSRHSSRVRFVPGGSTSSSNSTRSPQLPLPLRPTATPFPGSFDQWSVASSEIGGPARSIDESSLASAPRTRRPTPLRQDTIRAASVHITHTDTQPSVHAVHTDVQPPTARSSSELEYLALPHIPDGEPSPVAPHFRHRDDPPPHDRSGLTTPTNDPLLRDLPDEDRPIVHSGLTTPDLDYMPMPTSELPPVRVISDTHEHTPTRSQLDLPPIPIRPPQIEVINPADEPRIDFPEPHPHRPNSLELDVQPQLSAGLIPPMSEIPSIPTPLPEPEKATTRASLVDPPPQYEGPIKDVPDHISDGGSVISGTSRTEIINKADELRKLAQAQEKAKADYKVAVEKAKREKRGWDALWYEGEAENAETMAQTLNAKAAHRYFKAHNLNPEPQTIDVHRLVVPEAITEVKRALREARSSGTTELRIITGRGKHSKGNIPVLKKAIIQKLVEYQIEAKSDTTNPGVLVIAIPQAGSSSTT